MIIIIGDHSNCCVIKTSQNTEKTPGDLLSFKLQRNIIGTDVKTSQGVI